MPAKIRLARHGKKSRPYYFIVVADSRAPRDGKFIERIGSYNPVTNPATIEIDFDKALSWLQKGALPTDTVRSLLLQRGVLYKNHLLKGVKKGALTEEQVEQKFQEWIASNEQKLKNAASKMEADNRNDAKSRFAAETKVRDARAAATAKKYAKEAAAANAEEEPIQVTLAKPADEAPAEE
jgi:small subunit ribosomal protein S16